MATENQHLISEASLAEIMNKASGAGTSANPPASEEAEPAQSAVVAKETSTGGELDSAGVAYDPAIHTKSRAKRKNGEWKLRPNVTKSEAVQAAPRPAPSPNRPPPQMAPAGVSTLGGADAGEGEPEQDNSEALQEMTLDACKAAARPLVRGVLAGHVVFLGEDWETNDKEFDELVMACALYFYQTGQMVNMPPWLGLAVAYGSYAAPRFQRKTTRTRLAGLFAPIANFWKRRRDSVKTTVDSAKAKASKPGDSTPSKVDPFAGGASLAAI